MKAKIFLIIIVTIFLGGFSSNLITHISKEYEESMAKEYFGDELNQEEFKLDPKKETMRIMREPKFLEASKTYTEKYYRFLKITFAIRVLFCCVLAYLATLMVIKVTHNKSLKDAP